MASGESDDEPLSVLAASKKSSPDDSNILNFSEDSKKRRKKKKKKVSKDLSIKINLSRVLKKVIYPPIIERPSDVWMYLKDLKPVGPYSCLLCPEWFINRAKMITHYVLNHKKDYCGICRYLVSEREAYWSHMKFHTPWTCSQCIANFPTQEDLKQHLAGDHNLVHCRLCHFRLTVDQYNTHLFQKHNVSNVSSINEEVPWEIESDSNVIFHCLFCSKTNNLSNIFFNHYMGYHHFTLRCLTAILSGSDQPFTVTGVDVSADFLRSLEGQTRYGYIALEAKLPDGNHDSDHSTHSETNDFFKVLIPEIKQEVQSDLEDTKESKEQREKLNEVLKYKGKNDFDVTLTEVIVLEKSYFDYIQKLINDINLKLIPKNSVIDYMKGNYGTLLNVECPLCKTEVDTGQKFTAHMNKIHSVKIVPDYSCRVCATTFDTLTELENHVKEELGEFDDLWLCQFCDKEFDDREFTREHLTDHWDVIDYENCFSPHLGFKCRYCPTLFWNETDRETHQVRAHFNHHKDNFYKCDSCSNIFSDKIWFVHHYIDKHDNKDTHVPYLFKCCICCVVLKDVNEMRNHFESNHPEANKIFCSLDSCQYRPLSHRKSFKLHLKTVHDPTARAERPANCTVCGREFTNPRALSAHMTQVHGPGKFRCNICKEHLHTSDERKLHYLIRHPGHHPFACRDCGKSFLYKSSLYMHRQEHSPNKQNFTCSVCGKVFMKKDSFREHVLIHEGPRHSCSYCPMRFVQRSNMLRHERRHTGERPYACPHCDRTFADKGACTSHARTHSKDRSYACVYCGQTFLQKSKLTYHIRKHTGENLESCTVCSKTFTSPCALREHMKIHDPKKSRTVDCPLCDKKYSDERSMVRHLRAAHSNIPNKCPICRKLLASATSLKHHVLTHSPMNTFSCKCCVKTAGCKRTMLRHLRKRHGMEPTAINIKDYYHRLDPRECKLDLDEETLSAIFGPAKKPGIIGDFITYTDITEVSGSSKNNEGSEASADDTDQNDDKESNDSDGNDNDGNEDDGKEKSDGNDGNENMETNEDCGKLEPTDFVSVKLEPTDFVNVKMEPMDEDYE